MKMALLTNSNNYNIRNIDNKLKIPYKLRTQSRNVYLLFIFQSEIIKVDRIYQECYTSDYGNVSIKVLFIDLRYFL
jgi:hypothetical protein